MNLRNKIRNLLKTIKFKPKVSLTIPLGPAKINIEPGCSALVFFN